MTEEQQIEWELRMLLEAGAAGMEPKEARHAARLLLTLAPEVRALMSRHLAALRTG